MQILKQGNSKLPNWSLEIQCTGHLWQNKNTPCYSIVKLDSKDIVKRFSKRYFEESSNISYGFICPICHCFTEINEFLIPQQIKDHCLTVAAKGSDYYDKLNDEERKLSEVL